MASTPISQFVTGGGSDSAAAIAQMIAYKQQQDAAKQAQLDAFRIAPSSPFYKYVQDPSLIPHFYNESDADALARVKQNAMEYANQQAGQAGSMDKVIPGAQFTVGSSTLFDANHNVIPPSSNETNAVVTLSDGSSRYVTKAEAAQQQQLQQNWLKDNGYVAPPDVKGTSVNAANYNDANGVSVGAPSTAIPETPAAPAVKTNSKGEIVLDTSNLADQNDGTFYGLTTINGKQVYATTDADGNLIRAASAPTSTTQNNVITQYDSKGNPVGTSVYQPQQTGGLGGALGTITKGLGGIALTAAFPGLSTAIGSALGAGASVAPIVGGAVLGGATSAVAGGNPLTGAALGGLGGYLQGGPMGADYTVPQGAQPLGSEFNKYLSPVAPDYSLTGNTNPNLPSMGGGQGLVQNVNPNVDYMGGGQGITAPTSANLTSMGGGQGITTNAAGGGILGQTGVNTGANLLPTNDLTNQQLGTSLSNLNTGVTSPFVTGGGTTGTTGATGATGAATGAAGAGVLGTGLTAGQIAALGSGLGSVLGSSISNNAITNAQNLQNAAAATSQNTLKDIYNQNLAFTKPYQDVGVQGANALSSNMPYFQHQFDVNDLNTNLAPNYQFQLGQGQMANQRAANVGGGALSGNTLTGLNRYTQDYAGDAYQQAFNNYNTQRNNIYNTLSGIAGLGNTANSQAIGAGNTYGTNVTNLTTGLAAAQAGANIAQSTNQANTLSNLINNAALLLGQNNSPSKVGP